MQVWCSVVLLGRDLFILHMSILCGSGVCAYFYGSRLPPTTHGTEGLLATCLWRYAVASAGDCAAFSLNVGKALPLRCGAADVLLGHGTRCCYYALRQQHCLAFVTLVPCAA